MLLLTPPPLLTMRFFKRFVQLLEKVDSFLEKGLRLFSVKNSSESELRSETPIPTDSIPQGTDAPKVDETPSRAIPVALNDAVDVFPHDFATEDCNDGDGDLEDACSNAECEDPS